MIHNDRHQILTTCKNSSIPYMCAMVLVGYFQERPGALSDNIRKEATELINGLDNGLQNCEEALKKRHSLFKSAHHLYGFTESLKNQEIR